MKKIGIILLFSFLGGVIYYNSIDGPFVFDDYSIIIDNPTIKSSDAFMDISFWTNINQRPIALFSFYLNYLYGKLDTTSYHVVNVFIHIMNTILVWILAKLLLKATHSDQRSAGFISLFAALIFLTHPLQIQAVSYITQRMTSLAALFYFLSCISYIQFRQVSSWKSSSSWMWAVFTLTTFVFGAMTKQHTLTLILMYPLLEIFLFSKNGIDKRLIYIPIIVISLVAVPLILGGGGFTYKANTDFARITYFISQLKVSLLYLEKIFVPVHLNADWDLHPSTKFSKMEAIGMMVILNILILSLATYKKCRLVSLGILWAIVTISLESSFIPIKDLHFEHRMYLPMFGVGLVLASSLHHFFVDKTAIKFTIACLIVLTYSALTNARTTVWGDEILLWKNAYSQSPQKPRVNSNLGYAYLRINQLDSAQKYLEQAIYFAPNHIDALDGLGVCYFKKREYEMAQYYFKTVLQLLPDHIPVQIHLYELYLSQKKYRKCVQPLKKLIKLEPNEVKHVLQLHSIYEKNKQHKQANKLINNFLKVHPNNKEALKIKGEKKKKKNLRNINK